MQKLFHSPSPGLATLTNLLLILVDLVCGCWGHELRTMTGVGSKDGTKLSQHIKPVLDSSLAL